MKLTLETLPGSTNRLYITSATGRTILSKQGRLNKDAVGWEAREKYRGPPLTGALAVSITVYWPDARVRDVDNTKGFIDALSGILWEDDRQIVDLFQRKRLDRARPRVELTCERAHV